MVNNDYKKSSSIAEKILRNYIISESYRKKKLMKESKDGNISIVPNNTDNLSKMVQMMKNNMDYYRTNKIGNPFAEEDSEISDIYPFSDEVDNFEDDPWEEEVEYENPYEDEDEDIYFLNNDRK